MKNLLCCLVFVLISGELFPIVISPAKIEFINGQTVDCEIVDYKDTYLYFTMNQILFTVDMTLVNTVFYKDRKIDTGKLTVVNFDQLDFGKYLSHHHIENIETITSTLEAPFRSTKIPMSQKELLFESGHQLRNYTSQLFLGYLVNGLGWGMALLSSDKDIQKIGIGIAIVGSIFSLTASLRISKAGDYLIEYSNSLEENGKP